jgi:hypothetical protein
MRQARAAKPRPQLEAVLQRLFVAIVVVVGGILHDEGVVAFTDFSPLLHLPSIGISIPLGGGCGSEMNFFTSSCARYKTSATLLQAMTTRLREYDYSPPWVGARRSTLGQGTPCTAAYL